MIQYGNIMVHMPDVETGWHNWWADRSQIVGWGFSHPYQTVPEESGWGNLLPWGQAPGPQSFQHRTEYQWTLLHWCDVAAVGLPLQLPSSPNMGPSPLWVECWWQLASGCSPWFLLSIGSVWSLQTWAEVMGACGWLLTGVADAPRWNSWCFCLCSSLHSSGSRPAFTTGGW